MPVWPFQRLTQGQVTSHGATTRQCALYLAGRLLLGFYAFPGRDTLVLMVARRPGERVYLAVHLTLPMPICERTWVLFVPGASIDVRPTSVGLDVTTWFFQFSVTFNKWQRKPEQT